MGFLPEMSGGTDDTDIVVNINPAFLAVLTQGNGFYGMMIALSGPTLGDIWQNWFTTAFVEHIKVERLPDVLNEQPWQKTVVINNQTFSWLDVWANFTYPPNPDFYGFVISDTGSNSSIPSNIPLEVAEYLFNATAEYSLLNTNFDMAQTWYNAAKLPAGSPGQVLFFFPLPLYQYRRLFLHQVSAESALVNATGLTNNQLNIVINWINSQNLTSQLESYILAQYNLTDIIDISYLQWIDGTVTYSMFLPYHYIQAHFNYYVQTVKALLSYMEQNMTGPIIPSSLLTLTSLDLRVCLTNMLIHLKPFHKSFPCFFLSLPKALNLMTVEQTKFFLADPTVGVFNAINLGTLPLCHASSILFEI